MKEYLYAPLPAKKKEKFLLLGLVVLAGLFFAVSQLPKKYSIPWVIPWMMQLVAVLLLVAAVMLISRSLMRQYSYAISYSEQPFEEAPFDFVVTELYGNHVQVVCRVTLSEVVRITRVTRENRRDLAATLKGKRLYRYTAELFPENLYLVELSGEEETVYLYIVADDQLFALLSTH